MATACLRFLEGCLYVRTCFVVPFEGEAEVDPNAPVGGDIVEAIESVIQVLVICLGNTLDVIFIHQESKADVAGLVVPQPWCAGRLI